jgi:hypothetical protein
MSVPKFSVATEATPPIMRAARSSASSENLKGEKFFIGLGDVNSISVRERHENIPPADGNIFAQLQGRYL